MARAKHHAASILMAAGIVLVFTGLSSALGFTLIGMLASVAVIAGLLYAGGTWFGAAAAPAPAEPRGALVFDHRLELTGGTLLLAGFPEPLRAELRARCLAALAGERTRFVLDGRVFQALPIVDADGAVIYAVLIEAAVASHLSVA